jgi:hypothetical protein
MILGQQAVAAGPGTGVKATFRAAPVSIRFERFTVFQASASAGGHDFRA